MSTCCPPETQADLPYWIRKTVSSHCRPDYRHELVKRALVMAADHSTEHAVLLLLKTKPG